MFYEPLQIEILSKKYFAHNIDEISAEVNLQELLEKTTMSIYRTLAPNSTENVNNSISLICKWGYDGSSGHSTYKQKFSHTESTDVCMFLTAFGPLKLIDTNNKREIWTNPIPSSTMFCRPIKFAYIKESKDLIKSEQNRMVSCINNLQEFHINKNERDIAVNFKMLFTMLDGSAINTLSDTNASQNCFICGASPKQMNNADVTGRPPQEEHYRFGLSSLHC